MSKVKVNVTCEVCGATRKGLTQGAPVEEWVVDHLWFKHTGPDAGANAAGHSNVPKKFKYEKA
jgi:hypothetical protein